MPRFSAHLGYLFSELPLAERFAAARTAGFDVVEHPGPYSIPASDLRSILLDNGLELAQIAIPPGDASKGEKGLAAIPGREEDFAANLRTGIEYAALAGAPLIHVASGLTPQGVEPGRIWDAYVSNLSRAADEASQAGLGLLIEPIGRATVEGYFLANSDTALRALAAVHSPNIKLLFDVFHSSNDGVDPFEFISDNIGRIGHLHIADFPGRHEPGTGTLDFDRLFSLIDGLGFKGSIGCEYKPSGGTLESLNWFASYRRPPSGHGQARPSSNPGSLR